MRLGKLDWKKNAAMWLTQRCLPQTPILSTEPPQHDKTIVRKNETLEWQSERDVLG